MLNRTLLLTQIKDIDIRDYNPSRRISKTVQYKNSESIQEEEEHSSSQINLCSLKPAFLQTFPQQPVDFQGSEDIRVPTMTNVASRNSSDQLLQKQDSKKIGVPHHELSLASSSIVSSQLLMDKQKLGTDPEKKKMFVEQIKSKFFNSIHYSKYNDPLITQEQKEISAFRYHYFSLYIFLATVVSNFLTITILPLATIFGTSARTTLLSNIIFGVKLLAILQDLYFQRGPYKMIRGKVIQNFKSTQKIYIDSIRLGLLIVNTFIPFENFVQIILLLLFLLCEISRSCENFENIYRSTQYFVIILQMWVTIIISLTCLLRIFNEDQEITLSYYLAFSISLITHNANIPFEINDTNSIIVSIYLILSYLCILYTSIIILIWIKPEVEILEEKEKLLKGFVKLFSQKCQNQELLRRCYSYLEFRIDEDLGRAKDQLMKKLSPDLQDEVDLSLRTIMMEKIELMNKFSLPFKQQLLYVIEQVTFNPEDNIIIEHQIEDLGLYYILKGEVKVQFQGSSLGNNKRSVTRLQEGQAFGQYSFISGVPSNISIFSCGVTTLMKIKRSDFLEIISYYPEDNEIFCTMKDNSYYNQSLFECYYCKIRGHYILECQHIQYFPQRAHVIEKHLFSLKQQRRPFSRKSKKYLTLKNLTQNQEKVKSFLDKNSQDYLSEELLDPSYFPYSENYADPGSQASFTAPFQKQSQEQYISNSNFNSENAEYYLPSDLADGDGNQKIPRHTKFSTRKTLKLFSHLTPGFQENYNNQNQGSIDKDDKDILQELSYGQKQKNEICLNLQNYVKSPLNRNMPNKLTFQLTPDEVVNEDRINISKQQLGNENIKRSLKQQGSFPSYSYTNSISKDMSNNESSNSRQRGVSIQIKENQKKSSSDQTQSDQNKDQRRINSKTGTKQSYQNQMSQFQVLPSPENFAFSENDILFNMFEKMRKFKIYYPHNNFDSVLNRYQKFIKKTQTQNFRRKQPTCSPYSIKCYVASKIQKVKKLLLI